MRLLIYNSGISKSILISGCLHILFFSFIVFNGTYNQYGKIYGSAIDIFITDEAAGTIQKQKTVKHGVVSSVPAVKGTHGLLRSNDVSKNRNETSVVSLDKGSSSKENYAKGTGFTATNSGLLSDDEALTPGVLSAGNASNIYNAEFGIGTGPRFLHQEVPVYPAYAKKLNKEGKIILRLVIDEKGKLLNVEVVKGDGYGFTEAAIDAVKRSTFMPAKKGNSCVISRVLLPIRFVLTDK